MGIRDIFDNREEGLGFSAKALIALIFVALAAVGVIQYGWFSDSASGELEAVYKNLSTTVYRTVSREFQRYANLANDLRGFTKGEAGDEKSLRVFLERMHAIFGPEGSAPRLIGAVGYFHSGDSKSLLRYRGKDWEPYFEVFAKDIPGNIIRDLAGGELVMYMSAKPDSGGSLLILGTAGPEARYCLFVEPDTAGFFEAYMKPALVEALSGYSIDWGTSGLPPETPETAPGRQVGVPRSTFNPLRTLFSGGGIPGAEIVVPIPTYLESFGSAGESRDAHEPTSGSPDPKASFRPLFRIPSEHPREAGEAFRYIRIGIPGSSIYAIAERRLTLNWLFSTALLLAVALAFTQVVIQSNKQKTMRRTEREFVASVTHELRTPITVIRSAADNMAKGVIGKERISLYGRTILEQSTRLGSMIEEVLLYSRVEGGNDKRKDLVPMRPKDLIAEMRPALDALASGSGVRLEWDSGGLPAACMGEPESFRLIVENLTANAIYHAYPGESKGAVRVQARTEGLKRIRISVEDDGRGIQAREAKKVFEPFYRDSVSRKNQEKGTGLGLFLARRRAKALGGELRLESPYKAVDGTKKQGCRFIVVLPLVAEKI